MSGDRLKLEVREREEIGSRHTRRLRSQGLIPGVLYGKGHARAIVVPERELRAAMTGTSGLHAILDVVIEGQTTVHPSILAEYQQDPIRGTISHIDLREVRLDQPIHATVVVHLIGEPAGVKLGGMLSLVAREVQVEALPADVPEHIDVDVSHMDIGDVLRLADVAAIENVTLLDDPQETVIATVSVPRGFTELEEAEAAEAAEARRRPRKARPKGMLPSRRTPTRAPTPRSSQCASSVGASQPRRSSCSSRASATPARATSVTGTTSAGWSSTSSGGGTRRRFDPSSTAASLTSGSRIIGWRSSSRRRT